MSFPPALRIRHPSELIFSRPILGPQRHRDADFDPKSCFHSSVGNRWKVVHLIVTLGIKDVFPPSVCDPLTTLAEGLEPVLKEADPFLCLQEPISHSIPSHFQAQEDREECRKAQCKLFPLLEGNRAFHVFTLYV